MAPSRSVLFLSAALIMSAGPWVEASRRLRSSFVERNDDGISVWTPFGPVNVATRQDGKRNSTVVTTPFANVTTRGNETHVTTPVSNVDTNAHGTSVTGPITNVTTNGSGTNVTGPFTNVGTNGSGTNVTAPFTDVVTGPSVVSINGTNITVTPADCAAWAPDDICSTAFSRFDDVLSDENASEVEKDAEVRRFCATRCGERYTARLQGHLTGVCATPARNSQSRDDEEDDVDAQPAEDEPRTSTTARRPSDNGNRALKPRTVETTEYERAEILRSRVGEPLGCLSDEKGTLCALLKGCEFWKGCCGASLANAWAVSGAPLSNTTVAAIDEACPGAKPFVTGERSGC